METTDNPEKQPDNSTAMDALTLFVSKFSPATLQDADTFYSTDEIIQAVEQHTGSYITKREVYQLMIDMNYTYDAFNGMQFMWLLKGE